MSSPLDSPQPKGQPPYWLRDPSPEDEATHLRLLRKFAAAVVNDPPAKCLPNPLARTWHD